MPERRDEEAIRVVRVDIDHRDHLTLAKAEMRPGLAGVGGFVDAVAGREIGANDSGTGADVDDVRIGWRDGNGADRAGGLAVEDRFPVRAIICRAPHTAVVESGVDDVR